MSLEKREPRCVRLPVTGGETAPTGRRFLQRVWELGPRTATAGTGAGPPGYALTCAAPNAFSYQDPEKPVPVYITFSKQVFAGEISAVKTFSGA